MVCLRETKFGYLRRLFNNVVLNIHLATIVNVLFLMDGIFGIFDNNQLNTIVLSIKYLQFVLLNNVSNVREVSTNSTFYEFSGFNLREVSKKYTFHNFHTSIKSSKFVVNLSPKEEKLLRGLLTITKNVAPEISLTHQFFDKGSRHNFFLFSTNL